MIAFNIDWKYLEPIAEPPNLDAIHTQQEPMEVSQTRLLYSQAISLKRIADALVGGKLFTQPVNQYGESFTDAIQNSFVRGQNGIDTNYGR